MTTPFTLSHSPFDESPAVQAAARAVLDGQRINRAQAESLYYEASLHTLGQLAHSVRMRLHPEPVVTYVGDRNINYSNICVCACRFCAFFRAPQKTEHPAQQQGTRYVAGHPAGPAQEGYVITREELTQKIEETLRLGGTQILLQGGHHPDLPLSWYEELLAWMRSTWPSLHIHAFSPPEIHFWAERNALPSLEVLRRLKAAGLHSLPGGGAEILHDAVRSEVSPNKCSAGDWLRIMEEAHSIGLLSSATMMFGHEESPSHRLDHLFALREVQDRTLGFIAFIPWTFQPAHTNIHRLPEPSPAYLRLLAVSRLVLDNIPNVQSSWVTMGPQVAQLALFYGANDFGSLMIEENVVAAAGVSFCLTRQEIHKIIRAAGFQPVQRTQDYSALAPQPQV